MKEAKSWPSATVDETLLAARVQLLLAKEKVPVALP